MAASDKFPERVVAGNSLVVDVILSLDTVIYSSGDVLAETQVVAGVLRRGGYAAVLQSILVVDEDDQGQPFDIILLDSNVSLGAENAVPAITDVNARSILGMVSIGSGDYVDLGGVRIASKTGIGMIVKSASATSFDLYIAAIARGTPTYTASGVRVRLGFLQD